MKNIKFSLIETPDGLMVKAELSNRIAAFHKPEAVLKNHKCYPPQLIMTIITSITPQEITIAFNKKYDKMLEQAGVVHELLVADLALFTAEFPNIDADFADGFDDAISAADDTPGDDVVLSEQKLSSLSVVQLVTLSRRRLKRLYQYVNNAYEGEPGLEVIRQDIGYQKYRKAKTNQLKVKEALEVAYAKANSVTYKQDLIDAGFVQARITDLQTLESSLKAANLTQEGKKTGRPKLTQERIKALNEVWRIWKIINNASKVVFETDFEKIKQYLLYPEKGGNVGEFSVEGENAVGANVQIELTEPDFVAAADIKAKFFNQNKATENSTLQYWFASVGNSAPLPGKILFLTGKKTALRTFDKLGFVAGSREVLYVKQNGDVVGKYKVTVL